MPGWISVTLLQRTTRDWRLREVRLLMLALSIAVLAVTSIGFFTDRVERAIRQQGSALLGADLVVSSSRPISAAVKQLASPYRRAHIVEFRSVVLTAEQSLLTEIKAVSERYPLRGALETSADLESKGERTLSAPPAGQAWAAAEVFYRLGLSPGDSLQLGNSSFRLTRVIRLEPDAGGSVFRIAPRLMISLDSLADTGLVTPASRVINKLLIAGDEQAMARLRTPLKQVLGPSETLQTLDDGRPEISGALDRAFRFMKLASVLTIIISGAAVALAISSYTRRERHNIAILRALGTTRKRLWRDYGLRLTWLVLASTLLGSLAGYAVQFLLARTLADWLNIALPAASLSPLFSGLATAILTLAGFALPPLAAVIRTPPMHVMREDCEPERGRTWLSAVSISLVIAAFLTWQAGELKLASIVFAGLLGCLGLMLTLAWLITRVFRRFHVRHGAGWQLGLANIGRYSGRASLLITAIGMGVFALSLLGSVREDLITAWKTRLPENAPNHFLINIKASDLDGLKPFLTDRQIDDIKVYPMVRGRLRSINGRAIDIGQLNNHEAKDALRRELNLTFTRDLPQENTILAGKWFQVQKPSAENPANAGLSLELDIATGLGIGLGDTLGFDIGGRSFNAPVSSLRQVQWDTMQPNFYVIAAPGALDGYPTSFITAVRIAPDDTRFTTELVKAFPNITVLDVRAILRHIQRIIDQVSSAVEVVFGFSLLAGLVVLLAAIQTQRNERRQEIAVLKTLGARQQQIKHSVASEFMVLGALAGLLGSGAAQLTGWVLAEQIFKLSYAVSWEILLWGMLAGMLGLGSVGYRVISQLIHTSPTHLLQEI